MKKNIGITSFFKKIVSPFGDIKIKVPMDDTKYFNYEITLYFNNEDSPEHISCGRGLIPAIKKHAINIGISHRCFPSINSIEFFGKENDFSIFFLYKRKLLYRIIVDIKNEDKDQ